jgi:esterase/lipase superfamily enzyme
VIFATSRKPVQLPVPQDASFTELFTTEKGDRLSFGCATYIEIPSTSDRRGSSDNYLKGGHASKSPDNFRVFDGSPDLLDQDFVDLVDEESESAKSRALIFVHGYRYSFADAVNAAAEIAVSSNYPGRVYVFSWPSAERPFAYLQDADSATDSRPSLQAFLRAILREDGIKSVDIVAHSMGTQQLLDSIDRIRSVLSSRDDQVNNKDHLIGQVILAAPDVDEKLFKGIIPALADLSDRITVYVSGSDWAIALSRWLRRRAPRAGGYLPWEEPIFVDRKDVHIIANPFEWRDVKTYFSSNHADFLDDPAVTFDIRAVLTGEKENTARNPIKRNPNFIQHEYANWPNRFYWELPSLGAAPSAAPAPVQPVVQMPAPATAPRPADMPTGSNP